MTKPDQTAEIHPFPAASSPALRDPERLKALAQTELMDTPPEAAFDRAVRLATRLLGTPVGLVSLVDGERQFFKAQTGLSGWAAEDRQTPLTHSFCQHVVAANAPLTVHDARDDARVVGNLAIEELGVVAYLGVPLHAPGGAVLGSFCAIQSEPRDWTEAEREALEDVAAGVETEIALRTELNRSHAAETQAAAAEERVRLALQAGRVGTWDFDPVQGQVDWDAELYEIWGLSPEVPDVFATMADTIHPDDKADWKADVAAALDPSGPGVHDVEMRIRRPDTGETRWVHATGQATFENNQATRLLGTVRDVTERKDAEARERLLTRELNHRVKNLFAVVSGMIAMTARSAGSTKEMGKSLRDRVQALARAHALIQPAVTGEALTTTEVTLQTLAAAILEPHTRTAEAVSLSGPALALSPNASSSLALVLHEMATNAAKYGALSAPEGKLALDWQIERADTAEARLHLIWSETGGPTITAKPDHKGFGSTLIDMTVRGQMGGTLDADWKAAGVRYELSLPVGRLV